MSATLLAPSDTARSDALPETVDVAIIGSGIGGATLASGLAASGARIAVLERGQHLGPHPAARDARAIFQQGVFRPEETWRDPSGARFNPGNYYYVGGNSKFYGAVMIRYRAQDFSAIEHADGLSPAWPFGYDTLEPWYGQAERLFGVHGRAGEDPTEPPRSTPYPAPAVPDEPAIADARRRLAALGLHPFSLPLAVDLERWLAGAATPWDAYPNTLGGKFDAETAPLAAALRHATVTLHPDTRAERLLLAPDGRRIAAVEIVTRGERRRLCAGLFVLAAGAVNSAALLLRSGGIANRSGVVGRYFMNHNCTALLAVDPRRPNDAVYQKTLGINDFYLTDGASGPPLGNMQLLGKVTAPILKANLQRVPQAALRWLARHSVDWYLMSEDLPHPESRVQVDGADIVLAWRRSNMTAHARLVAKAREIFRAAGYPLVLTRAFDRRTPSHQCGTVRMGKDPAHSALDVFCRAHDHPNLFVVDAGFLPTSAAVNPALTIAAQALRVAEHITRAGFVA
jgi:choline dehydrogenase-like flavoprotein